MLKLFKRAKEKVFPTDPYKVIEQIHNDFDTAGEKLLKEAKEIIAKCSGMDSAQRLQKLGFFSALPVKQNQEAAMNKKLADTIEYFSIHYPNNKFITEASVKAICEKYGLLCGNADRYIGDIPEKNIREIEAFELRKADQQKHTCGWYKYERHSGVGLSGLSGFGGYYARNIQREAGASWGYVSYSKRNRGEYFMAALENEKEAYSKEPFMICAPQKDFNTEGMRKEGYKLVVDDPIVLQPVKDGYLIVSKWGLEGKDQSLVNEVHN